MAIDCDPGYPEPYLTLCRDYPDLAVYDPSQFRVEWGPIFHRGRLDGSARCLVIGQDPAQNENIVRRILVGVAGQRTQGLLRKLGLTRSYVLINTFLYSVYGSVSGASNPAIIAYRNRWITAILDNSPIEIVLALGSFAAGAWSKWKAENSSHPKRNLPFAHVTHPTQPESSSGGDAAKLAEATKALLQNWNAAIASLTPSLQHTDAPPLGANYGTSWQDGDIVSIPAADLPAGLPDWMGNSDHWASRVGSTAAKKRANITITVPSQVIAGPSVAPHAALRLSWASVPLGLHPHTGSAGAGLLALTGTLVTMTSPSKVLPNRTLYVRDGVIRAIRESSAPAPEGFEGVKPLSTVGLIFPGLMELHNHLAYNALPLWAVPKKFSNRDQWSNLTAYRQLISGPMGAISALPGILAALCRYVECKAIIGGATTSQGIALVNHNNIRTFFRGLLRNAELTDDPSLPAANARIGDVTGKDIDKFRKTLLAAKASYLLHLSEGTDDAAHSHFLALQGTDGKWALSPAFAGIHSVALTAGDFKILADNGSAMVWSPLSNLLLYGATANVQAAKAAGIRIGIGPDWSPSGSKNMLGELKVARAFSQSQGDIFSDEELIAMATRSAASILEWETKIGTIEEGKIADLLVVRGSSKRPYASLLEAVEADIKLVVIGGIRRFGIPSLMEGAGPDLENIKIGGQTRTLNLWPASIPVEDEPNLEHLSLTEAGDRLRAVLSNLGQVSPAAPHLRAISESITGGWRLALDEVQDTGVQMRTLAGLSRDSVRHRMTRPITTKTAIKLTPITIDPLTVADDPGFLKMLAKEPNLPAGFASAIGKLY